MAAGGHEEKEVQESNEEGRCRCSAAGLDGGRARAHYY